MKPACFPGVVLPAGATFSRRSARIHRNEQFVLVVAKGWAGPTVEASWPATTAFEPACLSLTRWPQRHAGSKADIQGDILAWDFG